MTHFTPEQIHFLEVGAAVLIGFALMFWCGWIARDGQVREALQWAKLAESRTLGSRDCAAKWEQNASQWSERASKAESRVAELLDAQAQPELAPDITGPSAIAPAPKPGRKRGARGRFINA